MQHCIHSNNLSCIRVLNTAHTLIYNKILSLSIPSRSQLTTGQIMNGVNIDTMSFYSLVLSSNFFFISPAMTIGAIIILFIQVGWIGIVAPLLFCIGIAIQQKLMAKGLGIRR